MFEQNNTQQPAIIPGITQPAGEGASQFYQQQQQGGQHQHVEPQDWSKLTKQDLLENKYPDVPPEHILRVMQQPEPAPVAPPQTPQEGITPPPQVQTLATPPEFTYEGALGQEAFNLDVDTLLPEIAKGFANLDFAGALAASEQDPNAFNNIMRDALTNSVVSALAFSTSAMHKGLNAELPSMFNDYHKAVGSLQLNSSLEALDLSTPELKPIVHTLGTAFKQANPNATQQQVLDAVQLQLKAVTAISTPKQEASPEKKSTVWNDFINRS